ncbi:hypothetical protein HN014_08190 [Aquimarina sp. TRL1]|uniref:hypothetical protein n=1 Tax=Aquimarina sp. (strain TRL1) TaxID=2736252 RepID=UPI001589C71B|nr:hypothetical protein [Aquimarina sp. TRL1]QKX04898.1 hypothetical protein HN014_08190 [Aquimarina sp. TRL1]
MELKEKIKWESDIQKLMLVSNSPITTVVSKINELDSSIDSVARFYLAFGRFPLNKTELRIELLVQKMKHDSV